MLQCGGSQDSFPIVYYSGFIILGSLKKRERDKNLPAFNITAMTCCQFFKVSYLLTRFIINNPYLFSEVIEPALKDSEK